MSKLVKMIDGPPEIVAAWNAMVEAAERLGKLTVAPPLELTIVGGIPCLSVKMPPVNPGLLWGKVYSGFAADATGPVKFWRGEKGAEVEDTDATDVYSRYYALATGREVYCAFIDTGWEVLWVKPIACQDMTLPATLTGWDRTVDQQLIHTSGASDAEACFSWEDIEDCP